MAGKTSYVPGNTKEHWTETKSADLRIGAVVRRNTVFFHDARNTGATGLWTYGNDSDLYPGRPGAREAWMGGISNPWDRDEGSRERGNLGAWTEYFPRLLAAARRNRHGVRRRLVPHGRSRRSGRGPILAHYRPAEEFDHPEFRAQYSSRTSRRGTRASRAGGAASYFGRESAKFSRGFGDRSFFEWIGGRGHPVRH